MEKKLVYVFPQGIGDGVMASAVAAAYYVKYNKKLCLAHKQVALFENNPNVECFPEYAVQNLNEQTIRQAEERGIQLVAISYLHFEEESKEARPMVRGVPSQNMLSRMAERVGLSGDFLALPRLYLTEEEKSIGREFGEDFIAIAVQGIEKYKSWDIARMEAVIHAFPARRFIQLGAPGDAPIKGAEYLCGKLTLRQVASVLSKSRCYIGPQGALIHLARAVDCPAIILAPSAEPFPQMAYPEYQTLSPETLCPYCTTGGMSFANCEYPEKCMEGISTQMVMDALKQEVAHPRQIPTATHYQLTPAPAGDLQDYYRQYGTGVPAILVTKTNEGSTHSTFRTLKLEDDGRASVIVQFNRECRFSSLQINLPLNLACLPSEASLWNGDQLLHRFSPSEMTIHGCMRVKLNGDTWLVPRKPLVGVVFKKALIIQQGDRIEIKLMVNDMRDVISQMTWLDRSKLKLAPLLIRVSKLYDNRWTRRLWNAGY
ncbi:MAG: hypothetical protein IKR81_15945 [Victivallales bacterium]|nr:hypothetical protein [Victivallales bacterium]